MRILQKSWEDEQVRLNRDINILQKKCDCLPEEIVKATRTFKLDHERLLQQEKTASKRAQAEVKKKCQVRSELHFLYFYYAPMHTSEAV